MDAHRLERMGVGGVVGEGDVYWIVLSWGVDVECDEKYFYATLF